MQLTREFFPKFTGQPHPRFTISGGRIPRNPLGRYRSDSANSNFSNTPPFLATFSFKFTGQLQTRFLV